MKKLDKGLAVFSLFVVLGTVVLASPLPAQAGPDVTVVNPPSQPVPVTGSVNIVVTDPVAGSVTIPLSGTTSATGTLTLFFSPSGFATTVPAGKRLVIEFVSVRVEVPSGQKATVVLIAVVGTAAAQHIIATAPLTGFGTADLFEASVPARIYADPATSVTAFVARTSATGSANAFVKFSGQLVDVP